MVAPQASCTAGMTLFSQFAKRPAVRVGRAGRRNASTVNILTCRVFCVLSAKAFPMASKMASVCGTAHGATDRGAVRMVRRIRLCCRMGELIHITLRTCNYSLSKTLSARTSERHASNHQHARHRGASRGVRAAVVRVFSDLAKREWHRRVARAKAPEEFSSRSR